MRDGEREASRLWKALVARAQLGFTQAHVRMSAPLDAQAVPRSLPCARG